MSSRASISLSGPLHIYEETNSWVKEGGESNFEICISDISGWAKCEYNGDVVITRKDLFQLLEDLKEFFKDSTVRESEE